MGYKSYTAEYKTKVVLEVLREEKPLGEIASGYGLNPNMVRNWKAD
ncbi:MAG: transposase, partial [Oscillibacter sp.]|nr:transposase [Oscillibacter sp.]